MRRDLHIHLHCLSAFSSVLLHLHHSPFNHLSGEAEMTTAGQALAPCGDIQSLGAQSMNLLNQ